MNMGHHAPPISNEFVKEGAQPFDRQTVEMNARCSRCGDIILGGDGLCDDDRPYPYTRWERPSPSEPPTGAEK